MTQMFQGSYITFTKKNPCRALNRHIMLRLTRKKVIRALRDLTVHDVFSKAEVLEMQAKNEKRDFCYAHVT